MHLYTFQPNKRHRLVALSFSQGFSMLADLDKNRDLGYFEIQKLNISNGRREGPKYVYTNLIETGWEWIRADGHAMPDSGLDDYLGTAGKPPLEYREILDDKLGVSLEAGSLEIHGDCKTAQKHLKEDPDRRYRQETEYRWYADPPEELAK